MLALFLAATAAFIMVPECLSQSLQHYAMKFTPPGGCPSKTNTVLNIGITIPVPTDALGVQINQVSFMMYGTSFALPGSTKLTGNGVTGTVNGAASIKQCCSSNGCDLASYAGTGWYQSPCGKVSGCAKNAQWYTVSFASTPVGSCSGCGITGTGNIGLDFSFGGTPLEVGDYGSGTTVYVSYYPILPSASKSMSLSVTPTLSLSNTPTKALSYNLIPNGDFEQGWTGFYSVYTPTYDSQLRVYMEAGVFTGPTNWYTCQGVVDHTTGSGKFFGADGGTNPTDIVWQADAIDQVIVGNTYRFQAWVTTLWTISNISPGPQLNFYINLNNDVWQFLGTHPVLPDGCPGWTYIYADYTPNESGSIVFKLIDSSTAALGNDFAIDDLYFGLLSEAPLPKSIQYTPSQMPFVPFVPSPSPTELSETASASTSAYAINSLNPSTSAPPKRINIIPNGDFEQGWTGFTTSYTRGNIYAGSRTANIYTGPINIWNMCNAPDHTYGTGNFLGENGGSNPNDIAWQVNGLEPVVAGSTYRFQAWVLPLTTVFPGSSPGPILNFYISVQGGPWEFLGTHDPIPNGCPTWSYIHSDYVPSNNGPFQVKLVNSQTASSGNDYALDDIYFGLLSEAPYAIQTSATAIRSFSASSSATAIRSFSASSSATAIRSFSASSSSIGIAVVSASLSTSLSASASASTSAMTTNSAYNMYSARSTRTLRRNGKSFATKTPYKTYTSEPTMDSQMTYTSCASFSYEDSYTPIKSRRPRRSRYAQETYNAVESIYMTATPQSSNDFIVSISSYFTPSQMGYYSANPYITYVYSRSTENYTTNSSNMSASPSFFPIMMMETLVNTSTIIPFSSEMESVKDTILGSTAIGISGATILALLTMYCCKSKGGSGSSLKTKLYNFFMVFKKNPSKLLELLKNPKKELNEFKTLVEEGVKEDIKTVSSDKTGDIETGEITTVTAITSVDPVTPVGSASGSASATTKSVIVPAAPVKKKIGTNQKTIVSATPVTKSKKVVKRVIRKVVAPVEPVNISGKVVKYTKKNSSDKNNSIISLKTNKNEETDMNDVEIEVIEDVEDDDEMVKDVEEKIEEEVVEEEVVEEEEEEEEIYEEEEVDEEVEEEIEDEEEIEEEMVDDEEEIEEEEVTESTILPGSIDDQDKVRIEINKEHLEEITVLLNALKKRYTILK